MKIKKLRFILFSLLFIAGIGGILTAFLSFVYTQSQDRRNRYNALVLQKKILSFTENQFTNDQQLFDYFNSNVKMISLNEDSHLISSKDISHIYMLFRDGKIFRYIVQIVGPGYDEMELLIAFEKDKKTLAGMEIVTSKESPGLGANMEKPWFKNQFLGKIAPILNLVRDSSIPTKSQEILAITGASKTSGGVKNLINLAHHELNIMMNDDTLTQNLK